MAAASPAKGSVAHALSAAAQAQRSQCARECDTILPFLAHADPAKATSLFLGYVASGLWELARATLIQMHARDADATLAMLRRLVVEGGHVVPSQWVPSGTVPSRAHLTDPSIPDHFTQLVAFETLLHSAFQYSSSSAAHQVKAELLKFAKAALPRDHGSHSGSLPPRQLSSSAMQQLKRVFGLYPIIGHAMCRVLEPSAGGLCVIFVEIIGTFLDNQQFNEACNFLRLLDCNSADAKRMGIDKVFRRLRAESLKGDSRARQRQVFEALLSLRSPDLLRMYCELCDKSIHRESEKGVPGPFIALDRRLKAGRDDAPSFDVFWNEFYHLVRVNGKHFFEYVMEKALAFIKQHKWSEAAFVLQPFPRLRPLLCLMCLEWAGSDVALVQRLLDVTWIPVKDVHHHCDIVQACRTVAHRCCLAQWCAKQLWQAHVSGATVYVGDDTSHAVSSVVDSEAALATLLYDRLERESATFLLQYALPVIDVAQLLDLYQSYKPLDDTVAGAIEAELKATELLLLRSYYAVKLLLDVISQQYQCQVDTRAASGAHTIEYGTTPLTATQRHSLDVVAAQVSLITKPDAFVAVLEQLFSLLFIRVPSLTRAGTTSNSPLGLSQDDAFAVECPELLHRLLGLLKHNLAALVGGEGHITPSIHPASVIDWSAVETELQRLSSISSSSSSSSSPSSSSPIVSSDVLPGTSVPVAAALAFFRDTGDDAQPQGHRQRVAKLRAVVHDVSTRLRVRTHVAAREESCYFDASFRSVPFMHTLLAAPDTLLVMALRAGAMAHCRQIMSTFGLSASHPAVRAMRFAELMTSARTELRQDGSTTDDVAPGVKEAVSLLPDPTQQEWAVWTDLAAVSANTVTLCRDLLDRAHVALPASGGAPAADAPPGQRDVDTGAVARASVLLKHANGDVLEQALLQPRWLPRQPEALERWLQAGEDLSHLVSQLVHAVTHRSPPPPHDSMSAFFTSAATALRRVVTDLRQAEQGSGAGAVQGGAAAAERATYVEQFVRHTLLVATALHEARPKQGEYHVAALEVSPADLVTELLFDARRPAEAEALAHGLGMNVHMTLIRSLVVSGAVGQEGTQADAMLSSVPRTLQMPIVSFVARSDNVLAALLCVLRGPGVHLEQAPFWNFALSQSGTNKGAFGRWMRLRLRSAALALQLFMGQSKPLVDTATASGGARVLHHGARSGGNVSGDDEEEEEEEEGGDVDDHRPAGTIYGYSPASNPGGFVVPKRPVGRRSPSSTATGSPNGAAFARTTVNTPADESLHVSSGPEVALLPSHERLFHDAGETGVALTRHQRNVLKLLCSSSDDVYEQSFYVEVVGELQRQHRFEDAVEVADSHLRNGAPDTLLQAYVESMRDDARSWEIIIRINDKVLATKLVLKVMHHWNRFACMDLLYMCRCHLSLLQQSTPPDTDAAAVLAPLVPQVERLHETMEAFAEVVDLGVGYDTWQDVQAACDQSPDAVVRALIAAKRYTVARKLATSFGGARDAALASHIEEAALRDFLEDDQLHSEGVVQALEGIHGDAVGVVQRVLERTSTLRTKLCLVQFLQKHPNLPESKREEMTQREMGIKVLMQLHPSFVPHYRDVIHRPELIVESLIMCEHTLEAERLFRAFPSLRNDELVITYAKKALDMSHAPHVDGVSLVVEGERGAGVEGFGSDLQPRDGVVGAAGAIRGGDHRRGGTGSSNSMKWILTGDVSHDRGVRLEHQFDTAPSVNLATTLFDLCSDATLAGETCLQLCDSLSKQLSTVEDHLLVLHLIQHLLFYAKVQFSKDMSHGSQGVALCQTFLQHVELLHSLFLSKCGIRVSLADFSSPQRARHVRDRLIKMDWIKLANDVATKCRIETEPVWAAWGLQLLRQGQYNEAKEKFEMCLGTTARSQRASGGTLGNFDQSRVLQKILDVLESETPPDSRTMRERLLELRQTVHSLRDPNAYFRPHAPGLLDEGAPVGAERSRLNTVRYMQCIFYLSRYGTPMMMLRFWMRHNLLEDAVRYVLANGMTAHVIVDEVVRPAIQRGKEHALMLVLARTSSKVVDNVKQELLAVCKYLRNKNAFDLLLGFQKLMNDWVRAGLTCIKLFQRATTVKEQMRQLDTAQDFFLKGLSLRQQGGGTPEDDEVMKERDISKYYQAVCLQMAVTRFYDESEYPYPRNVESGKRITLFTSKNDICIALIVDGNFDLGSRIISDCRLNGGKVYAEGAKRLASNPKAARQLSRLFQFVRDRVDEEQWDRIILGCIQVYAEDAGNNKAAEKLIGELHSATLKVRAFALVGKLKSSYLAAAKTGDAATVEWIRSQALKQGGQTVVQLCNTWLAKRQLDAMSGGQ